MIEAIVLTSFVERLFFQFPDLLRLVQIMSQFSHTNGMISFSCEGRQETNNTDYIAIHTIYTA